MPEKWTGRLIGQMHNNGVYNVDIAKELGVSKSYVGMILNGKRNPCGARERLEAAYKSILAKRGESDDC